MFSLSLQQRMKTNHRSCGLTPAPGAGTLASGAVLLCSAETHCKKRYSVIPFFATKIKESGMDQLKRVSGEEAGEYQSHTFATSLFGKVDETHPNFIKLRQQIVAEGVIHTPAIEYEDNLIAGRKR